MRGRSPAPFVANLYIIAWLPVPHPQSSFSGLPETKSPGLRVLTFPPNKVTLYFQVGTNFFSQHWELFLFTFSFFNSRTEINWKNETFEKYVNMFVLLKTETNDYAKHIGKTNMNIENVTSLAGKWDVPGMFYSIALEKSH